MVFEDGGRERQTALQTGGRRVSQRALEAVANDLHGFDEHLKQMVGPENSARRCPSAQP